MKVRSKLQILTAALLLSSWGTNAQAASEEELTEYSLEELVVSTTRSEISVKDAPNSVVVITREDIEKQNANSLAEVLRSIAGLQVIAGSGPGGHTLPAVSIRGSESDHVLLLIDGRRIGTYPFAQNARDLDRVRLDDVERIEIVKGPGSVLYGSNALGGLINVILRKPTEDTREVYLSQRYLEGEGSFSTDIGAYVQAKERNKFSWSAAASRNHGDSISYTPGVDENYGGNNINVALNTEWAFSDKETLQLNYRNSNEDLSSGSVSSSSGAYRSYYKNDRDDYGVKYTGRNKDTNWYVDVYRSAWTMSYYNTLPSAWADYHDLDTTIAEGQVVHNFNNGHIVTGGLSYMKEDVRSTYLVGGSDVESAGQIYIAGQSLDLSETSDNNTAGYLQDEWRIGEKFLVIPAFRVEHHSKFGDEFVPKIGMTYFAEEDLRFKLNFGKGYRTPSLTERYMSWNHHMGTVMRIVGNPDLEPETSKSIEVAVEKDWKDNSIKLALYRSEVDNLINMSTSNVPQEIKDLYPDVMLLYYYQNIDKGLLQGAELSGKHSLSKELSFNWGYNYLHAIDRESKSRLEYRPRHQFSTGLVYAPLKSDWSYSLDSIFYGDYLLSESSKNSVSFNVINVMANYKFGKDKKASIYLGVENVLNKEVTDLSNYGRTYVLGASYKF